MHPNFPGQFRRLAAALARDPALRVWGMGDASQMAQGQPVDGVQVLAYPAISPANDAVHPMARGFEQAIRRGEQVVVSLSEYKRQGLEPDVIVAHPGWGDAFFVRDFFPGARVVGLFEYFYHARGADVGFDPEFPTQFSDIFRLHASNATQLLALESCDDAICSTAWQRAASPRRTATSCRCCTKASTPGKRGPTPVPLSRYQTARCCARVTRYLPSSAAAWNLTGVSTSSCAHCPPSCGRGRSAEWSSSARWRVSYGSPPAHGGHWKEACLRELDAHGLHIDPARVHFTGSLPHADYLRALQISRAHVYLTYPFILSWSLIEAMSVGCVLLTSNTAPVQEVIEDGEHGLMFPFRDHASLARLAIAALAEPARHVHLGQAARERAQERFDFETVSLPAYRTLLGC